MRPWTGVVTREGIETGDGRIFVDGAFYWDDASFPLPLRWAPTDEGWHDGAVVVGTIDTLERRDGGVIWGTGMLDDTPDTHGAEAARMMDAGTLRGISIDPDDWAVQVIDTTVEPTEDAEALLELLLASAGEPDPGDESGLVLFTDEAGEILERYLRCRIRAATLVDIPAFIDAVVTLGAASEEGAESGALLHGSQEAIAALTPAQLAALTDERCLPCEIEALAAAGAPVAPPAAWFANPGFTPGDPRLVVDPLNPSVQACPLTVTDDGQVFGHIAPWGQCHTGSARGECILTPRSASSYAYFATGALRTAEGTDVPVGQITLGGGHASLSLSYRGATEHYDDVASALADVCIGEDAFGVWVAGALRPDVAPERERELRASSVSGDWRPIRGGLELVAVHGVNSPGFPIARVASGETLALVAAGAREMARMAAVRNGDRDVLDGIEARLNARLDRIEAALVASAGEEVTVALVPPAFPNGGTAIITGSAKRAAAILERSRTMQARQRLADLKAS